MAQTQAVTPLRQRMLDDMKLRNMAAGTRRTYVRSVADFSAFHGRSPDELTLEDVRDYQLPLVARGLKASIPSGRTAFLHAAIPRKLLYGKNGRGWRTAVASAGYSLRSCFTRAIASSTACSGLRPLTTTRWIAFGQTCSCSTSRCRHLPETTA